MQSKWKYSIIVLWFLICGAEKLPQFIHVCHEHDPNIDVCLMAATEDLRPYLVTGVPEYQIPSLEPLIIHDLISEHVAGMKIRTSNVSAYGCSDFFVRYVTYNSTDHTARVHIDFPKLRIESDYEVDGKVLMIQIKGNGRMKANITDITSETYLRGEIFERNGEKYLRFIFIDLKINLGSGYIQLYDLFNGDKVLLGIINDAVNRNVEPFLKEFTPPIERGLAKVFMDIANKIVDNFTYKQLFPD